MADEPALVRLTGIGKRFGGVVACADVDFVVQPGEVQALLGENGAGKSTLVNIMSGVLMPDQGRIEVGGTVQRFARPADAQAAGIATIHQELDLVGELSIAENMSLGREPRRFGILDRGTLRRSAREQLQRLGIELDVDRPVRTLRVGERQLVEIANALQFDARVLIMDEPTASLADAEVDRLFAVIDQLRRAGVGIVYISHRMDEIEKIADRATVLRNGQLIGSVDPAATPRAEIISMMVGGRADRIFADDHERTPGEVVLQTRQLAYRRRWPRPGRTDPDGVDLTVRAGEIVGLAGLMGAGRTELLETLYGAADGGLLTGEITLSGRRFRPRRPKRSLRAGVAMVPEDRRGAGLVLQHSVAHNLTLSVLSSISAAGVVRSAAERRLVDSQIDAMGIRAATPRVAVGTLSGGNQQKVVFGRQLLARPRLLMLDEPTRGVDIGAKAEIYRLLSDLAADGTAVLMASSELPELVGVCDRIVVLRRGRVVAELAGDTTQDTILAAAMGELPGDLTSGEQERV
ncbi:sugar ABC transporter ATP-binding protein [Microlunatus soli]|uniref:Monosaccharide ABC transporter ATP-binding protein, CUT2 family n=1 Tax=Microlunatus soli TaxID=630515 RepID=A0A1H1WNW2_9ACTN|nr:sugar ABC transporter ATP-binding protein [Microlunatus soli]SDS98765.1 monosaccharide ABC transporter ATP-binding protein, CUT2 family [Microlunatus soli]